MKNEELNRRYGAPGRIAFHDGHAGYPEVVLANKYGSAEVSLLGGNVLSYRPTGQSPVLFRPATRDYNRADPLHGGIPVCWPQFGKLAIEGLAGHGFARLLLFEVRGTVYSEDMTEITLGVRSNAETKALWPYDFDLEFKVCVSMKLNLTLTTKNTGAVPFSYTAGFHPYFLVRDRDAVTVRGLDGCAYVDARDMKERVLSGDLAMRDAADHVFTREPAPKHECVLLDPGLRRAIAVVSCGDANTVVWNPGPLPAAERPCDLAADDWKRFVCVEAVTAWPKALAPLAPGESSSLTAAIQATVEHGTASEERNPAG